MLSAEDGVGAGEAGNHDSLTVDFCFCFCYTHLMYLQFACVCVSVRVCVSAGTAIFYFAKYMWRGWLKRIGRGWCEWVAEPVLLRFVWGSFVKCHGLMMQLLLLLLLQLCRHLVGACRFMASLQQLFTRIYLILQPHLSLSFTLSVSLAFHLWLIYAHPQKRKLCQLSLGTRADSCFPLAPAHLMPPPRLQSKQIALLTRVSYQRITLEDVLLPASCSPSSTPASVCISGCDFKQPSVQCQPTAYGVATSPALPSPSLINTIYAFLKTFASASPFALVTALFMFFYFKVDLFLPFPNG